MSSNIRISIGTKISLLSFTAVALAIMTIAVFSTYYFRSSIQLATEAQVSAIGKTIQANIESSLALGFKVEELAGVNERLGYMANSYREISSAYIINQDGKILFHDDPSRIGSLISYIGETEEYITLNDGNVAQTITTNDTTIHEVTIDIKKNNTVVAYLKLDIPDAAIIEQTLPMVETFTLLAILSLMGALVASFAIGKRISRPIADLEMAAMAMARGNFNVRAKETVNDEVGDLSRTFNWMIGEIKRSQDKLEQNIAELRRLLEMKTEFLHIIDHQLRTPLSVMRGYLDFWRTGQYKKFPPEKQEDIKTKIIIATDQLSAVIHSMIDALEVEGGKLQIQPTEFNLGSIIKEVYEVDFAEKYDEKGIAFKTNMETAPTVMSDKRYITAVITNLMDNALRYTPKGEVTMSVYSDGTDAVMEIADTGIGLSDGDAAGLFRKFVRGEEAHKISPAGSGMGLYIARQILEALGGSIQAYSKGRNMGSLFVIKIPLKLKNEDNKENIIH